MSGLNATINLRKATPKDAADLIILDNLASHGMSLAFWQHAVNQGEALDALDFARQRFSDPGNVFGFANAIVAEKAGIIVGGVTAYEMEPVEEDLDVMKQHFPNFVPVFRLFGEVVGHWFIDSLAVFEDHRGLSIGGKLVDKCLTKGRKNGYAKTSLVVEDGNKSAMHLYKKRGFELVKSLPFEVADPNEKSENWLLMTRLEEENY